MANLQACGLTVLRIAMGIFLFFEGLQKLSWFLSDDALVSQLQGWQTSAGNANHWYLEHVCLPGAPIFARIVPLGELVGGVR